MLIAERFGIPLEKIKVARNGTDVDRITPKPVEGVQLGRYFLMVGVNYEYKNHKRVLEAFLSMEDQSLGLVVTCNNPEIAAYLSKHPRVVVKRYLGLDELVFLYRNALALVYPSLMEGFGLPALEAARLDTPIITSKGSPMEEFLGAGNAVYVDPLATPAILAAMNEVARGGYPAGMLERARIATSGMLWEKTASEVLAILDEAQNAI